MHALTACRNAPCGRRDGWFPPPDDGSQPIATSFRRRIMSKKKAPRKPAPSKAKKGQKSKAAESQPEGLMASQPRKLIPELAAMNLSPKLVASLEALDETQQDRILQHVNSGMKIRDAYQRVAGDR